MDDLFIFAGETSGDLHGEKLLHAILERQPSLKVFGVAGPRMRALGMESILQMEQFQVMGFIDVFLAFPKLLGQFYQVQSAILERNPKTVLLIDYPGFNLRLARALKKKGFKGKICHYICPSVWAWGKKRIPLMAENLDSLLTIFPFEKHYFSDTSLDVKYVGHPLVKKIQDHRAIDLNFPKDKKIIALFPGSRFKELNRNFPLQLKVAKNLLKTDNSLLFVVSVSENRFLSHVKDMIRQSGLDADKEILIFDSKDNYDLMRSCHLAIAKSGTVTLELALHHVPTVVMYAVTRLDQFIALQVLGIRLRFYCLVNIIAGEEVFPELIGTNLTEQTLFATTRRFLTDPSYAEQRRSNCRELSLLLGEKDAAAEAAIHLLP